MSILFQGSIIDILEFRVSFQQPFSPQIYPHTLMRYGGGKKEDILLVGVSQEPVSLGGGFLKEGVRVG